jgi:uncharacterized protein YdhG (YjbR/CyaY superfamily)
VKKYSTVEKYIAAQPVIVRPALKQIRKLIKKNAPAATEKISYGMPGYFFHGMVAYFAAFKAHYTFFARPRVLVEFKEELKKYSTSKAGIRIPFGKPVPAGLISKILKASVKANLRDAMLKEISKGKK